MKDYSDVIRVINGERDEDDTLGFVTSYTIDKDKIIARTSKDKSPLMYVATPETAKAFADRTENQYNLLIENQDAYIEYKESKIKPPVYISTLLLTSLGACLLLLPDFFEVQNLIGQIGTTLGIASFTTGAISISAYKQYFKEKMQIYKAYLKKRKNIEVLSQQDDNITNILQPETKKILSKNQHLQEANLIDCTYSVDLLDKMSLKELRELLIRFGTVEALGQEQVFKLPSNGKENTQSKPKTRTKKKTAKR